MLEQIIQNLTQIGTPEILTILILCSILNGIILIPSSQLILIIGGIISQTHNINSILILTTLITTNTLGNWALYALSKKYGIEIMKKYLPIKKQKLKNHLTIINYLFKKHGNLIIIIGRNLPILHSLISVPAGISKIATKKYLTYTTIGITTWSIPFFYLGKYANQNLTKILQTIKSPKISIIILIGLIITYIYFKKSYKNLLKKAKTSNPNTNQ